MSGFKDETDDLKKMLEALIKQIQEQYLKNLKLFNVTESLKEQIDRYQSLVESNKEPDSGEQTEGRHKENLFFESDSHWGV